MTGTASHALLQQALSLAEVNRLDAAMPLVHRALAADPDDVTALTVLAYCLSMAGRHEEVLAVTRQAAALAPDDSQVHQLQARALVGLHHYRAAIAAAREGHRLAPDDAQSSLTLAIALAAVGNTRNILAAAVAVARARALAPENPDVHFFDGYLQFRMAEFGRARAAYRHALSLAPEDETALLALACLDIDRGRALLGTSAMGDSLHAAPTDDVVLRTATVSARAVLWLLTDIACVPLAAAVIAAVLFREEIAGPVGVGCAVASVLAGVSTARAFLRSRLRRLPAQIRTLIRAKLFGIFFLPAVLRMVAMVAGMLLLALSPDPGADSVYETTASVLGFAPLVLMLVTTSSRLATAIGFVLRRGWYRLHGSRRRTM